MRRVAYGLALSAFLMVPAMAADLPVKAPPAPVVVAYSWTGCYVGAEGGYKWGKSQHISRGSINGVATRDGGLPITPWYHVNGGEVGGEVGCNYQTGNWVFGVEADGSWTSVKGDAFNVPPFAATGALSGTKENWLGTARGRVGYALPTGLIIPVPTLWYVTGGVAVAGVDVSVIPSLASGIAGVTQHYTADGWVVGWGSEYALGGNWSVKEESLYMDFHDIASHQFVPRFAYRNVELHQWLWRVGLNYRFTNLH